MTLCVVFNNNNNKHLYSTCSTECAHRRFTVEWQEQAAFTLKKNPKKPNTVLVFT